ncbi:MAG: chloride channel protein [Armatimonas sp.]
MPSFRLTEVISLYRALCRWTLLGALVGLLCGSASALFLNLLERATRLQETHANLLYALPIAGLVLGAVYQRFGKPIEGGSNLLLDRIHQESGAESIPFRLAPMVLLATVWTHLFGGSAGREGTAVQMGGTLASLLQRPLKLSTQEHRLLLMCGISGGFSSVFGTPLAGTLFGMEVLSLGLIRFEALLPCFVAAYIGDVVCKALGITHHIYTAGEIPVLLPPSGAGFCCWECSPLE